jgi:hypothetical protein
MNRMTRRSGNLRTAGWLAAAIMVAVAALAPATAFAAGPGNNGLDPTGNGTTSNATVGGSLSAAGGSATMAAGAVMTCDGTSVDGVTGSFTLTKTLDVGSTITIYMVPNNGSDASPAGNVTKNETTITLTAANNTSGSVINWSLPVTHAFTTSQGGILVVFAVNDDGTTAISSSKTNSLNCTEAQPTPTPVITPAPTPVVTPEPTPVVTPEPTPVVTPEPTPVVTPEPTPVVTPEPTPVVTPEPTPVVTPEPTPVVTPGGSVAEETATPAPTGEVKAETAPPTDTIGGAGPTSGSNGWRIALIGLAALIAGGLFLTAPRRTDRKR